MLFVNITVQRFNVNIVLWAFSLIFSHNIIMEPMESAFIFDKLQDQDQDQSHEPNINSSFWKWCATVYRIQIHNWNCTPHALHSCILHPLDHYRRSTKNIASLKALHTYLSLSQIRKKKMRNTFDSFIWLRCINHFAFRISEKQRDFSHQMISRGQQPFFIVPLNLIHFYCIFFSVVSKWFLNISDTERIYQTSIQSFLWLYVI